MTRMSATRFIVYMGTILISWYFKKQSKVETSLFGNKFVVMKQGINVVRGIWNKLRMMKVTTSRPS